MEAVRQIIDSEFLIPIINLPESMMGSKVEVIVLPIASNKPANKTKSMKGFLKQYANPELIGLEKEAWERAAVEKHGHI